MDADAFLIACKNGDKKFVTEWIDRSPYDCIWGLEYACLGNSPDHREIVELLISKGANNWHTGFMSACEGGNRKIIELMISKGVKDWRRGLVRACAGGHREIVELMIAKGAYYYWNQGLAEACQSGHREIY